MKSVDFFHTSWTSWTWTPLSLKCGKFLEILWSKRVKNRQKAFSTLLKKCGFGPDPHPLVWKGFTYYHGQNGLLPLDIPIDTKNTVFLVSGGMVFLVSGGMSKGARAIRFKNFGRKILLNSTSGECINYIL